MVATSFIFSLAAWALAGLLGGVHCLGMCGGLATALGLHAAGGRRFALLLAANGGRLLSYMLIGALLGGLSGLVGWLPLAARVQTALYLLSLLLIMLLGFYLAGWSSLLMRLEKAGGPLWRLLQPRFSALLPLRTLPAAWLAGALWGWLPCGLVYTAATGALASGSAGRGCLILLAFGLGTLPNLMAMGLFAAHLHRLRQQMLVRRIAGGLLAAFGALQLIRWLMLQGF